MSDSPRDQQFRLVGQMMAAKAMLDSVQDPMCQAARDNLEAARIAINKAMLRQWEWAENKPCEPDITQRGE